MSTITHTADYTERLALNKSVDNFFKLLPFKGSGIEVEIIQTQATYKCNGVIYALLEYSDYSLQLTEVFLKSDNFITASIYSGLLKEDATLKIIHAV